MNTTTVPVDPKDLSFVVQMIDVCSRRGAFEGHELVGIGDIRSRFLAILDNIKNQEKNSSNQ